MKSTWLTRSAGVLLPVSSLPSKYGIGSFGKAARDFIDFLSDAKQKYWQVLPMGPTSFGDSPYQSYSAFAGEPLYIDLELLCEQGLLDKKRCKKIFWGKSNSYVDYDAVRAGREVVLREAFESFKDEKALQSFRRRNAYWVEDYALFMALKSKSGGLSWTEWEENIRLRRPDALKKAKAENAREINYHIFTQYLFFSQWKEIRKYAKKKGVKIIGDAPIYVALDSSDVWARPELFQLDENNMPTEVAGCPPDAFSEDGQLWGNPLYRWDFMEKDGFSWWIRRLKANMNMYDALRIDHFRGFESYCAIPAKDDTAKNGKWKKGPGMKFIRAINEALPGAAIIAEDLGILTPAVHRLLKGSGYPGMKILQFAFSASEESTYLPHNLPNHCVVYTGTHDNDTTRGWWNTASKADKKLAMDYLGLESEEDGVWAFVRAALSSVADLAVIPMQDYLGLGSEARTNIPSTVGINWKWRMKKSAPTKKLAKKMARLVHIYGRARKEQK